MNTKNMIQEQISTFADGELDDSHIDVALGALRSVEGRDAWAAYHEIGDVLRSDDMAISMSSDFAARLMKRLDDEPTVIAPRSLNQTCDEQAQQGLATAIAGTGKKRFTLQGMAAMAAVITLVITVVPQIMFDAPMPAAENIVTTTPAILLEADNSIAAGGASEELLRDASIDEYLLAHQRLSPSIYSAAQYARSTTFAIETDK